jgi:uncharacterized protein (DUF1499 family)
MTEYPELRRSRAPGWCRRTASFAAVLLAVVWIGHHYGLVETQGYLWVLALVALLAALALLLAAVAFSRIWTFGDRGGRDLVAGVLIALLILFPYGFAAYLMLVHPPLRDITTDLDTPPALPTATNRTADMNPLLPQSPGEQRLQAENYPLATGRRYELTFDETVAAVEAVLVRQGWRVADLPPADAGTTTDEVTIGAVASSFILDLPVDVSLRISVDGDSTLVDMRSASRYGRHDLGDNARRIGAFLTELDQQVNEQIGAAAAQ